MQDGKGMPLGGKKRGIFGGKKNVGQTELPYLRFHMRSALAAAIDGFLQFGAGNELRNFLGRNLQRSSGLWIATGSRLARTHRESSETNQRHFVPLLQRRHHTVERGIESIARLDF